MQPKAALVVSLAVVLAAVVYRKQGIQAPGGAGESAPRGMAGHRVAAALLQARRWRVRSRI
jgi:hypothetical protein